MYSREKLIAYMRKKKWKFKGKNRQLEEHWHFGNKHYQMDLMLKPEIPDEEWSQIISLVAFSDFSDKEALAKHLKE